MRTLERRLTALEANALNPNDQRSWPWFKAVWKRGEPRPSVPEGHNAVIWKIITPGDPPEWMNGTAVINRKPAPLEPCR